MSGSGLAGFSRSLAVLVGIDRYTNGVPELRTPVADVESLAELLRDEHGFRTKVVADEKATIARLRQTLKALARWVRPDDRVLFYFAGHGIALESDEGPKGYILPQDADRNSTAGYLPMVELDEALSALRCRHMLVVLDCCFAGAFRWSSFRHLAPRPENLHQERYAWFIRDPAWQAIASAAHDQKAIDVVAGEPLGQRGDGRENSPFARALLGGLKGAADRAPVGSAGDGVITATELFSYLQDELLPPPFRQAPILWPLKNHHRGEFVFLVPGRQPDLPPAPPLDPAANPWRGLQPYESKHAGLFFGRGRASEQLRARVLADRFVVVTGPSGIGKSSLVRAGLLPQLPAEIQPLVVRPGPQPFASLAEVLKEATPADGSSPDEQALKANRHALADWVKARTGDRDILLVIDQTEELITQTRDAKVATDFLALLANALAQTEAGLRVVITIRSEFEPQFAQSPLSDSWATARYLVPQMTQDELRRVIEKPAAVKVMRFEDDALVDQLVNEVVNMPGALPLLSFALSEMYAHYLRRRSNDRTLTWSDYNVLLGGVTGSLGIRANQVVDGVDEAHRATARRILERLVAVDAGEFARRRVAKSELEAADPEENARIGDMLERLDAARLIVTDEADGKDIVELAHDALILGWDRLLTWVREDAERILTLRRLTPAAEDWARAPRPDPGLLWDDAAQLASITKLQKAAFPGLNRVEHQFAQASVRRSRRNRIVRWSIAAALVLLTAGASGAAFIANNQAIEAEEQRILAEEQRMLAEEQRAQAEEQRQIAVARLAASEAARLMRNFRNAVKEQPSAVLLAVEALRRLGPNEAEEFLVQNGLRIAPVLDAQRRTPIEAMRMDPTGTRIAVASSGSIQIVPLTGAEDQLSSSLQIRSEGRVQNLEFSSNGQYLAALYGNGVAVFDIMSGDIVVDRSGNIKKASFDNLSQSVAWSTSTGIVTAFDLRLERIYFDQSVDAVDLLYIAKDQLLIADRSGRLLAVDRQGKSEPIRPEPTWPVAQISVNGDRTRFIVLRGPISGDEEGNSDGYVELFDASQTPPEIIKRVDATGVTAEFLPDGKSIVLSTTDGKIGILRSDKYDFESDCDLLTEQENTAIGASYIEDINPPRVNALIPSPDGTSIFVMASSPYAPLRSFRFDPLNRRCEKFHPLDAAVEDAFFVENGKYAVVRSDGGAAAILNMHLGATAATELPGWADSVYAAGSANSIFFSQGPLLRGIPLTVPDASRVLCDKLTQKSLPEIEWLARFGDEIPKPTCD